ncbi:MAG TPA: hypothetical protein VFL12_05840, partial [Thermoanaerobaculia bacterium]|nr:hypothetical protein [Thermoanaerobaculia bacterium]
VRVRSARGWDAEVRADGRWAVTAGPKRWTFAGEAGGKARDLADRSGEDALGPYHEIAFASDRPAGRRAAIRLYDTIPAAMFLSTADAAGPNTDPFPTFRALPAVPYHLSYNGAFFQYSFEKLGADAPWIFFDGDRNAFVLSAASHYVLARTRRAGDRVECGIDPAIPELPAGWEQRTLLVAGRGIGETVSAWGHALTRLSGKPRPANDAGPELDRIGYWTDNGAAYYYKFLPGKTADETLLDVAARFRDEGIPLGYVQLDSWWYPKGKDGGFLEYRAAGPPVFSGSLADFRRRIGVPFVVHGRWLSSESPIRERWKTSGSVVVDPEWWASVADEMAGAGVATFEQDWLGVRALPLKNIVDPEAFLGNMARAFAARGIHVQYCMAFPGDVLQSTLYPNVTTARLSSDRFERKEWAWFLHGALLERAVGLWPWVDVFRSREIENMLLALLSAGVVGPGDAIGEEDRSAMALAARRDGVLVKPDLPIAPTDDTLVREARGEPGPILASTLSDFGGWKGVYAFAYGTDREVTIAPASLGVEGPAFVFDVGRGRGVWTRPGETFRAPLEKERGYYLVVPAGPSGVAFLGDEGKLVAFGKKRIASVSDDGALRVTVLFAAGEREVRLHGFSPARPDVRVERGSAGAVEWKPETGEFRLAVSPDGGEARVALWGK